ARLWPHGFERPLSVHPPRLLLAGESGAALQPPLRAALLVFYQVLAALQSQGGGGGPEAGLRNGADVILQSLFIALAGAWGPVLFMACLIAVGLWLVVRDLQRHPGVMRP